MTMMNRCRTNPPVKYYQRAKCWELCMGVPVRSTVGIRPASRRRPPTPPAALRQAKLPTHLGLLQAFALLAGCRRKSGGVFSTLSSRPLREHAHQPARTVPSCRPRLDNARRTASRLRLTAVRVRSRRLFGPWIPTRYCTRPDACSVPIWCRHSS